MNRNRIEKSFKKIMNEAAVPPTPEQRKKKMEMVKNMSFDELIDNYMPDAFINDNGELEKSEYFSPTKSSEQLIFSNDSIKCTIRKSYGENVDEKHWIWHPNDDYWWGCDLAKISSHFNIPVYVLKLIFEKFNKSW